MSGVGLGSFTLLNPGAAAVTAGITLPVLLALYLLKLRRRPVRVSSTLLWPSATQDVQVNVPLRRLRWSWLLLVQLLALLALILAMGRPAWTVGDTTRAPRIILLIDRSASMSAGDGRQGGAAGERATRLDEAKALARAELDRLRRGGTEVEVAVVAFALEPTLVLDFTANLSAAAAEIDAVTPSDQPDDIAAALRLTRALAEGGTRAGEAMRGEAETGPDGARRATAETWLFSDGALRAGNESSEAGGAGPAFLGGVRLIRAGAGLAAAPADATAEQIRAARPRENAGIIALTARRDEIDLDLTRVFVRVQSTAPRASVVGVVLAVNGVTAQTRTVNVPAPRGDEPLGRAGVTFELRGLTSGVITAALAAGAEDDLLASDNTASVEVREARPPRVLLVRPTAALAATGLSPDAFLADALRELKLGDLGVVDGAAYQQMANEGGLRFYDLVIFDRVEPATVPPLPALGLGATLGLGASVGPGATGATVTDAEGAQRVVRWDRAHPVLRYAPLGAVEVSKSRVLAAADPARGLVELARGERGALMMAQEEAPRRLVTGFALEDSNFPVLAPFPLFLDAAVRFLTRDQGEAAAVSFTTAQAAAVAPWPGTERMVLEGPVRVEIDVPAPRDPAGEGSARSDNGAKAGATGGAAGTTAVAVAAEPVTVGVLPRAGVYVLEDPSGGARRRVVCVNLVDAHESAVAVADQVVVNGQVLEGGRGGPGRYELWRWCVLAAGALMIVEWVVFGLRARV